MKTQINKKRVKSREIQNKRKLLSPIWQLVVFVAALVLIYFLVFIYLYKIQYSATLLYFDFASKVLHGGLPYRDFNFEYPPFSLLFFILPRLFTSVYIKFVILYKIEVFIFILVGLFLAYNIARRLGKAPWKMLAVYTLGILAIGPIIAEQYDFFPAIITLLALYFFWLGKHKTSWGLLALGTMTKFYPLVIAPIFLIYYLRNHQYKQIWSGVVTFGAICLIIILPFLIIDSSSLWNLVNYHSQRGLQLETILSSFLLVGETIGLGSVKGVYSFGSWNLSSPAADILAKLSIYLLAALLLIAYWFIYRQMKPGKSQFTRMGAYSLLVVTILLIGSKILSPQYLIWLIPLVPLIFGPFRYTILFVFAVVGALTYYIYPHNYLNLMYLNTGLIYVLFLRNILIILLAVLAWFSLHHMKGSD